MTLRFEQSRHGHGEAVLVGGDGRRSELAQGLERRTASIRTYDNLIMQDHARAQYGDNHYGDQHHYHHARSDDGPHATSEKSDPLKQLLESLYFPQKNYWLTTIEPAFRQTCQWLFETPEYTRWRNHELRQVHHGMLWLKGKPGAGKSTITKCALEHANATYLGERNIHFFFNARGNKLEKCTEGIFRSLLHQVAQDVPWLLEAVDTEAAAEYARTGWPVELLRSLFREAVLQVASEAHLNCYIDALDEGEDEEQIRDLVAFFEELSETAVLKDLHFSVYFASRHYPHISVRLSEDIVLDDYDGHHDDIESYAQSKLVCRQPSLKDELVADIIRRSSGVFLWVVLVVRILNTESDRGNQHRLRTSLRALPKGLDNLFSGIIGDGDTDGTLLPTLLWVFFAKRALTPVELYFASVSCITPDSSSPIVWDREVVDETSMNSFVVSSSRGLLQVVSPEKYSRRDIGKLVLMVRPDIDRQTSVFEQSEPAYKHESSVQFIHESVREYLLKSGIGRLDATLSGDIIGKGNLRLARWCQRYLELSLSSFHVPCLEEMNTWDTYMVFWRMLVDLPFLSYALAQILRHSEEAACRGFDGPIPFGDCLHPYLPLYVVCNSELRSGPRRRQTSLHVLTMAGCRYLILKLLDQCPQDGRQSFISSWIDGGHEHGSIALQLAVDTDRLDILQILLSHGADVHARGARDAPVLLSAARSGTVEMMQEIMNHGADFNARDAYGSTALHGAVLRDNLAVIELLLRKIADTNISDGRGETALHLATLLNKLRMIELLLKNNADVNRSYPNGRTALHMAVLRGNLEVIEILIQNNADVNASDNSGKTALHVAASYGKLETIEVLLKTQTDVNALDNSGATPLIISASFGRIPAVESMLRHGASVDAMNRFGYTALRHAVECGNTEMTKTLLTHGADRCCMTEGRKSIVDVERQKIDQDSYPLLTNLSDAPLGARLEAARALGDEERWKEHVGRETPQMCLVESEDTSESDSHPSSLTATPKSRIGRLVNRFGRRRW
jgi:ankyrin repeat protein